MIKIGTDFSGIGAPEQALKKLGVEHKCMFACDVDKYAKKSYLANYNPEVFYDDIKTRDHKNAPDVDLYVAGFPCQAFSIAGRRKGFEDTRGTLFFDLLQYLKEKKPKYFILENVKGLLSHDKGQTFNVIIDSLAKSVNKKIRGGLFSENQGENLGYHIYHKVLNTKNFGIPQNRERIFIVGFREDKHSFKFPKEIPLEVKLKDVLQNEVDEKFYLSEHSVKKLEEYNKRNKEKGNGFRAKFHDTEKDMMSSLKVGGQAADDLIEIKGAALRTHPRTSNPDKDKKEGRSKRLEVRKDGLANSITTHHLDSIVVKDNVDWVADFRNDEGLRKRKDKIAPCLSARRHSEKDISTMPPIVKDVHGTITGAIGRAGSSSEYLSSVSAVSSNTKTIRRLTPLECMRLQGFPDDLYHKCKEDGLSDTQLYKQAGNSMTVDVMAYLIKEILKNEI